MIKKLDEERLSAENEIRLFLRLFPILAAHFQLRADVDVGGMFRDAARVLAERYENVVEEEKQGDKAFVHALLSVLEMPLVKKPILDPDE